jgi:hypothetical protein
VAKGHLLARGTSWAVSICRCANFSSGSTTMQDSVSGFVGFPLG